MTYHTSDFKPPTPTKLRAKIDHQEWRINGNETHNELAADREHSLRAGRRRGRTKRLRVLRGSHTPRDYERVFAELPLKRRWAENSVHSLVHSVDMRGESEHHIQSCGKIGSREIRYLPKSIGRILRDRRLYSRDSTSELRVELCLVDLRAVDLLHLSHTMVKLGGRERKRR